MVNRRSFAKSAASEHGTPDAAKMGDTAGNVWRFLKPTTAILTDATMKRLTLAAVCARRRRKVPKSTHGGKRKGAGRKPALFPVFLKKLRATNEERKEFMSLLTGDARQDFVTIIDALKRIIKHA